MLPPARARPMLLRRCPSRTCACHQSPTAAGPGGGPGGLHRPEHGLGRGRAAQVDAVPRRPERRRRLPQRLPHAERQHQRRLADRLRPVHRPVLGRPLQQRHPEVLGHLREARQLVRARRLGGEAPAGVAVARVPPQVLQREPARALHEPALDLAEVDQRGEAVADVVHDVDPPQPVGAGEPVDLHLAGRRPVREVLERLAVHPLGVPVQARRAVETGRPQLHPR